MEVLTRKLSVRIELEFSRCKYTEDEASNRVANYLNSYMSSGFSNLITQLLRTLGASLWDLKLVEVTEVKEGIDPKNG